MKKQIIFAICLAVLGLIIYFVTSYPDTSEPNNNTASATPAVEAAAKPKVENKAKPSTVKVEPLPSPIQNESLSGLSYLDARHNYDLDQLKGQKIIRALVVPSRTDFYIREGKIDGLMVRILNNYEKWLNKGVKKEALKTRIVYIPVNFDELLPALLAGKGDIAASFLTITSKRKEIVNFASNEAMNIDELIVINKNSDLKLSSINDLAGQSIYVLNGSSYIEHLQALNKTFSEQNLSPINIIAAEDYLTSEDILEMLNAGAIDITVTDDFKARLWAKVLPNIEVRDDLIVNKSGSIAWAVRKNNPLLHTDLSAFSNTIKRGTYLGNVLFHRFLGRDQKLSNLSDIKEREDYHQLVDIFKRYGQQYDFNYLKLMAQAYQESGLKQGLHSHRGAVGVMQILPSTAQDKNVNIANIDQLENNIHAGVKYMNFIRERYYSSPDISPENQVFFSWAAYNAGPANVRKMRKLADEMGLDKNVWFQNVEIAAGRIIGVETVRYVANIYKFYSTYLLMEYKEQVQQAAQ